MVKFKHFSSGMIVLIGFALVFCGCNPCKDKLATFNRNFESNRLDEAWLFADKQLGREGKNPSGEDLLWALQLGSIERIRANYAGSTAYFDRAEDMLKYFDEQNRLGDVVGTTVVNDNILPYRGQEYDGIMVNVYKGLNFIACGKRDLARVEFNRALDRQRRAKEKFVEEIAAKRAKLDAQAAKNKGVVNQSVENPKLQAIITEKYPNISEFAVYPDFVNPFATYMAGVFFYIEKDYAKSVDLLKESAGMVKDNPYVAEDLVNVEQILSGQVKPQGMVWVVFENGVGPVKEETRLDLPLFVVTNDVKYVGIALPRLKTRWRAYANLMVTAGGREYRTWTVADMEGVINAEFKKEFPVILQRAIISATAKAVAQYAIQKQNSDGASVLSTMMAVYSFATTAADVRIWTSLPREFQVARFAKPLDGKVKIVSPGVFNVEMDVKNCDNAIIYVRGINGGLPWCSVMRM